MRFKIENRALNITNYPSVERHFEEMAKKGWLINKIIFESIFIYNKIEPEELDFSISPYELETAFTKKSKSEVEEFRSVCQLVGWNYAAKTMDLHIYFKEKGSQAVDLETDEEEEFNTLEKMGKKQVAGMYFSIILIIFLHWFVFLGFVSLVDIMQNGLMQVVLPLVPVFIILLINQIIRTNKFLKENKKNIKLGKDLEYRNSKFYFEKTMYLLSFIIVLVLIVYTAYVGVVLKNTLVLFSMVPLIIGGSVGYIFRMKVKPSRLTSKFKVILFIVIMGGVIVLTSLVSPRINKIFKGYNDLDMSKYRVLWDDKFDREDEVLLQNASLLIPRSYEYSYYNHDKKEYIITEYSDVLNENLAKTVVDMYKREARHQVEQYEWTLDIAIEEDNYRAYEELYEEDYEDDEEYFPDEKSLEEIGMTLEEFQQIDKSIKNRAIKEAIKILEDKAVREDKENLWNLEEVYFLSYDKTKVVIRVGKEVFYLDGIDFTDPEIIKMAKDQLDL